MADERETIMEGFRWAIAIATLSVNTSDPEPAPEAMPILQQYMSEPNGTAKLIAGQSMLCMALLDIIQQATGTLPLDVLAQLGQGTA